jgi:hypothetical protein
VTARTICLALSAIIAAACGGRSDAPAPPPDGGSSTPASPSDGGDGILPPGVAYISGGAYCCEKGIGRSCCPPDRGCAPYGGGLDACLPAGSSISGKDTCTICCEGLGVIGRSKLVDGKCADDPFPDDGALCAACGDGFCHASAGENPCNCPADCGPPP